MSNKINFLKSYMNNSLKLNTCTNKANFMGLKWRQTSELYKQLVLKGIETIYSIKQNPELAHVF